VDRYLIVRSHEKLVGVIIYMADGVAVGGGPGVQRSVVAAGTPTVVLLGYDVEGGRPGALGAASRTFPQHGVEFALAMASRSGASRRGRQVTGGPGSVRMW
jgi:hypothetical protein